ncbi:MAG: T9SS type A sorting domain-containing protein [Bacteroidota bacterium]|nr:T9SS type A sorting domain-containing protein [Bacteroidota bacterium]
MNGYKPTNGGMGQLCMNCHHSRYNVATKVTSKAPYYGFSDHYGPHHNPQADMLFGQNAYEYGQPIAGLQTHGIAVKDACVTCHMQDVGSTASPNHTWSMTDTSGNDLVGVCQTCHGAGIASFDDVKASADYDGNGKIEGVQTEIQGMLDKLKAQLPKDAAGEPVSSMADSLKVKDHPEYVRAIYDYYFVKEDGSMGVHNAKYAFALLQAAIGSITGVQPVPGSEMPKIFELSQNYPNPFNPTTEIQFSVPRSGQVNLSVYNVLGEVVATLANGEVVPGNYKVQWNATDANGGKVSSGIYFYRLVVSSRGAANYSVTKKMLLLK